MTAADENFLQTDIKKQFGFLRSTVAVSIITVVLLFVYSNLFLVPSFTTLTAENTEGEAIRVATHMANTLLPKHQPLKKATLPPDFASLLAKTSKDFDLIKVKLFSPSGETIFSTSAADIGKINKKPYFHNFVSCGEPYTKVVKKNSKSLEDQVVKVDVVETYVPIMEGSKFLGAFEIYFDITTSKKKLDRLVHMSNLIIHSIGVGLLLAMSFIAFKARSNILARHKAEQKIVLQTAALQETNSDLSILNEISAAISSSIDMDRLLPGILEAISSRFKGFCAVARGGIFLLAGDKLILKSHLGHDDEFLELHKDINIGQCLCGQAAETGEIIFCTNSHEDERHTLCCKVAEPHGHIIIPLTAHHKVVGVLYLYTDAGYHPEDKKQLLQNIGNQVGLAIDNASLYRETKRLSLHDPLTGLANRRLMEITLSKAVALSNRFKRPLSVAMIDLDFFKKYNDTMGHAAGDELLISVASIIKKEIREADFAARYGGEEFLVILPETNLENSLLAGERIRKTIQKKSGVTISTGIAAYKQGSTVEALLKSADNALYKAKDNGRNRVELSGD